MLPPRPFPRAALAATLTAGCLPWLAVLLAAVSPPARGGPELLVGQELVGSWQPGAQWQLGGREQRGHDSTWRAAGAMAVVAGRAGRADDAAAVYLGSERQVTFYTAGRVHRERIPPNYYIVTPDGDRHAELLSTPPLFSLHRLTASLSMPRGARRRDGFMFEDGSFARDLTEAEAARLGAAGRRQANLVRITAGLFPLAAVAALIDSAAAAAGAAGIPPAVGAADPSLLAAADDCVLVSLEHHEVLVGGSPAEAVECLGSHGSHFIVHATSDAVVLTRVVKEAGVEDAADQRAEITFGDGPITGPHTVRWGMLYGVEHGGSTSHILVQWETAVEFNESDHEVTPHETICQCLRLATAYDQLNISELASFEALSRVLQMIQGKRREGAVSSGSGGLGDAAHLPSSSDASRTPAGATLSSRLAV